MTLKYTPGRFFRNARLDALNLLLTYDGGCKANCAYCGLSKSRESAPEEKTFIRVDWPTLELDDIISRTKEHGKHLQRVCISMITHSRAFDDMCTVMERFRDETDLLISGLIAPTMITKKETLEKIKESGADKIGVAVDAVTEELFNELRGQGVQGPHSWDHYWEVVRWGSEVFGRHNIGVHLVVGLGETEKQMIEAIQSAYDLGAKTHLFSFYPEPGSGMKHSLQPPLGHYRRVQLARYIINKGHRRLQDMDFNASGQIVGFGMDTNGIIEDGEAFMTSGCEGKTGKVACNRPYGNERPSRPMRNFPFLPEADDIIAIRSQLRDYSLNPAPEPAETGITDTGNIDTGITDTGTIDTGITDTGITDTTSNDHDHPEKSKCCSEND